MRHIIYALCLLCLASSANSAEFSFVAYGDTSYTLPRDHDRNRRLVDAINAEKPAFAVHVGDFVLHVGDFGAGRSCDDSSYQIQLRRFERHDHPVVMTPGDNDWSDCREPRFGGFDPLERLSRVRSLFFATDQSLGRRTMPLIRQNSAFPENARWIREGVIFATVHAVGPHNNLIVREKRFAMEAIDRGAAGEAWIREAFRAARETGAPALVIAFQVDPWIAGAPTYEDGPLDWIRRTIGEESLRFGGQVLIVHGDSHRLTVDHPFRRADIEAGTTSGMNVTRLQVPGWPDHRAVRVDVDTSRAEIFGFRTVMAREERLGAVP